jgi:PhoH-like ATPase
LVIKLKKVFVLDTCIYIHDSNCLNSFKSQDVVLPISTIEELDNHKSGHHSTAASARAFSRNLDKLREQGSLLEGIKLESGGIVRVSMLTQDILNKIPAELCRSTVDNSILATALDLRDKGHHVVVVSNDTNLRLKAGSLGLEAESYESGKVEYSDLYTGHADAIVSGEQLAEFFSHGIHLEGYSENQCLTLYAESNLNQTGLGIIKNGFVRPLSKEATNGVSKIRPANREQCFALALLLDDEIPLITINGRSGCGKSLLTLAAGLAKVQEGTYSRMLVSKPTIAMGGSHNEIGFLPGELRSKLDPWLAPIKDNLDIICGVDPKRNKSKRTMFDDLEEQGVIQAEALAFIRGRSLQKQWFWIDEASNISPSEAKALLTRIGEGSRIVLTGDPEQIDSPYLNSDNNGLSVIIEKFRESKLAGTITLEKGVRSPLSEEASRIL